MASVVYFVGSDVLARLWRRKQRKREGRHMLGVSGLCELVMGVGRAVTRGSMGSHSVCVGIARGVLAGGMNVFVRLRYTTLECWSPGPPPPATSISFLTLLGGLKIFC